MKITNNTGLPEVIARAVQNDPYTVRTDYTVTGLLKPPRIAVLTKKHWDAIEEDVSERVWALFGQAVHAVIERASGKVGGILSEMRYKVNIEGRSVSGQADMIDIDAGKVADFKVTKSWGIAYKSRLDDWRKQLNMLAFLIEHGEPMLEEGQPAPPPVKIKTASIIAIARDWGEKDAGLYKAKEYPQAPIVEIPIPLWCPDDQERCILDLMEAHERAKHTLPDCTEEERWWDPKKKEGRRCKGFCSVAKFCTQFNPLARD